jgi:hypothetical protein
MPTADLVHDPEEQRLPLNPLRFLLGRFSGEGRYLHKTEVFQKEIVGDWEAGGGFIGLRMRVTYPLADGRKDIHEALVMIGADPSSSSQLVAQAYTDGGAVLNYALELQGSVLSFEDRPPTGHGNRAKRARKRLVQVSDGFEEWLDVDWGEGRLEPYSVVVMRRVEGTA